MTVLAMILAVFFAQIHPQYLSTAWKRLRSLTFGLVAGYGLVPTVHWICITGGFSSELVQVSGSALVRVVGCSFDPLQMNVCSFQAFVPRVLGMYLIAALALVFYVSKVPERYFPGESVPLQNLLTAPAALQEILFRIWKRQI